ncbi:MAG: Ig-like domain-containing protein, partial [Gemmatimonadales bacterium]
VAFAVTAGEGAQLVPDTVTTGADGRAGARWVLGRDVGTQRAQAELVTGDPAAAPSVVFSASASPGSAAALVLVSGDDQSAPAGSALPDSLVVRATDQFGNPVAGVSVAWGVTGGGSVSAALVTTGANGRAAVRRILGNVPGSQGATASAGELSGSPAAFSHTATPSGGGGGDDDDSRVTIISGNDQTGEVDKELRDPLVIRVTDQAGRGVAGASVAWVVTEGGGAAKPVVGTTDGSGRASTRWTLGREPGRNRISAAVPGLGTVTFEARGTRRGGDHDDG